MAGASPEYALVITVYTTTRLLVADRALRSGSAIVKGAKGDR